MHQNVDFLKNPGKVHLSMKYDSRAKLCGRGRSVVYKKKTIIPFSDKNNDVILIQSGLAALLTDMEDGKPICLGLCGSSGVIGLEQLYSSGVIPSLSNYYIQVISPIRALTYSSRVFAEVSENESVLSRALLDTMIIQNKRMLEYFMVITSYKSEEKVRYLIKTLSNYGVSLDEVTHNEIAIMLNMNRFTVTKCLKNILFEM